VFANAATNREHGFILGADDASNAEFLTKITTMFNGIKLEGRSGYFDNEQILSDYLNTLAASDYDFIIVGMGAVKQEEAVIALVDAGFKGRLYTCGGFIHQTAMSDGAQYYPAWVDRFNLRFAYRMFKEPSTVRRRILGALSALIAAYSVTNNLSVSDSGLFFLSLGFALFFSHFLRFGLDNFVMKKCAIYLSDSDHPAFLSIVLVSAVICILGSVLIYSVLYVSGPAITYEYMNYLLLAFPAALAIALLGIIAHSLHAAGFVFTGAATNTSLNYIIFSILIWMLDPPDAANVIVLFSTACYISLLIQISIALFIYTSRGIAFSTWKNVKVLDVDYKEIYRTTLPLWMVVIAQQLNQWGAQFISSVYVAEEQLALLAIAMRLALLVPMVLTAVNMVVSPKFAAHHHKGEKAETEAVLAKSLMLLAAVSSVVFLVMVLFGSDVLAIFGDKYVEAGTLLTILVCGQLVNAMTGPSGNHSDKNNLMAIKNTALLRMIHIH